MSLQGRRVLVIGGAGFIGSHIVEALVRLGARVRVYDDFSSGTEENLVAVRQDLELIRGDILDADALRKAMEKMEYVSHQAAQLEIMRCLHDPLLDLRINTIGTLNVFKAAVEAGVQKVINASSACVYGYPQQIPQTEEHPTRPNWPYGASKRAAELYASIFEEYHRLPIVNLRYGITYGPREWYGRVLTIFVRRALEGKPLVVFGRGDQMRDFLCVHDLVTLHNLCLEQEAANGKTYNVGTGVATTIAQLAQLVARLMAPHAPRPVEVRYDDPPQGGSSPLMPERIRLPLELKAIVLGVDKARAELGWQPTTSLEQGLREEIEWFVCNRHRWQNVHI